MQRRVKKIAEEMVTEDRGSREEESSGGERTAQKRGNGSRREKRREGSRERGGEKRMQRREEMIAEEMVTENRRAEEGRGEHRKEEMAAEERRGEQRAEVGKGECRGKGSREEEREESRGEGWRAKQQVNSSQSNSLPKLWIISLPARKLSLDYPSGNRNRSRMELAYTIVLLMSYLTFLGSVMARLEVSLGDKKKWDLIRMNRMKRDLTVQLLSDAMTEGSFVRTEDTKDSMVPQSSNGAHIRVKRYRQSFSNYPQISYRGCKFGTCIVHDLAHKVYQYTDKDKDSTAPARKMSSQGYGRRRRSIPERRLLLPVVDGKIQPWWVSARSANSEAQQLVDVNTASFHQEISVSKTKGKLLQTLLRT
ncbi:PREDICTED: ADM [Nanorana parkeri]|uniref:ADM n=1 Tax=Nanorana parkeri TaxID=125878 RepID=UPI000854CA56|nr:PREDICTED: ADM [Nanorana parkeri]